MAENSIQIDIELAVKKAQSDLKGFFGSITDGILIAKSLDKAMDALAGTAKMVFVEGIKSAQRYEDSLNGLNVALAQTGNYSKQTSVELEAFANQMEASTRFSDDATLSAMSLIQSLGRLDKDGLKKATTAAADLATVLKVDLQTAAMLVGKVSAGEVGVLGRYGIELKSTGDKAKDAANGLAELQRRFGGAAAADVKTFSGAMLQAQNAGDDFRKAIGQMVTQNPVFIATIKVAGDAFRKLTTYVEENRGTFFSLAMDVIPGFIKAGAFVLNILDYLGRAVNFVVAANTAFIGSLIGVGEALRGNFSEAKGWISGAIDEVKKAGVGLGEQTFFGKMADEATAAADTIRTMAGDIQVSQDGAYKNNEDKAGETAQKVNTWEMWLNEQRKKRSTDHVKDTKDSLAVISGLMQSGNRELFQVGKAAAIAQATINGYEAVTKAFAIGGPLGFVLGPLVAAAVAAQIAGIIAQQPGFATGGIVGGTSYTGDAVPARLNSREMVLTLDQQTALFNGLNQGAVSGGGVVVNISGNLIVDSPERVDDLIGRINERVRYAGTPLYASEVA